MRRLTSLVVVLAGVLAASLAAQAPMPPPAPPPPPPPSVEPPSTPRPPEPPEPPGTLANVQVEVTVTEQGAAGTPERKTVTLTAADGSPVRSDSRGSLVRGALGLTAAEFNLSVRPRIQANGLVRVEMSLHYVAGLAAGDAAARPTTINQNLTVLLPSGRPMTVSRAADPASDRRLGVEVTATVLK